VGGEFGPKARVMEPAWATDLRDQCRRAGVPFFFKQWGGKNKKQAGRVLEGRTWEQMPDDPGGGTFAADTTATPSSFDPSRGQGLTFQPRQGGKRSQTRVSSGTP